MVNELIGYFSTIAAMPSTYPEVAPGVRRLILRRFPYAVYYVERPDRIVVMAIQHQHRSPNVWKRRVIGDTSPPSSDSPA